MHLLATIDESPSLLVDILSGITIFALGLATLVSPLTTAVLADADEANAGIASGVNNAVARVAGLLATAAVGTLAGGTLRPRWIADGARGDSGLLVLGGITGLIAIRDPRRVPVVVPARAPAG